MAFVFTGSRCLASAYSDSFIQWEFTPHCRLVSASFYPPNRHAVVLKTRDAYPGGMLEQLTERKPIVCITLCSESAHAFAQSAPLNLLTTPWSARLRILNSRYLLRG